MTPLEHIRQEIEPMALMPITNAHDEARLSYRLEANTVEDYQTLILLIGNYLNHHLEHVFEFRFSQTQAQEQAKEIIERCLRKTGGNLTSAYHQCHTGLNGGVRKILDLIADDIRDEGLRRHINNVIDTYINPTSWEERVDLIRNLINALGIHTVDVETPERYAADYKRLTETYLENLRRSEESFFRL